MKDRRRFLCARAAAPLPPAALAQPAPARTSATYRSADLEPGRPDLYRL